MNALVALPSGLVVSGGKGGGAIVWDVDACEKVRTIHTTMQRIVAMAVGHDESTLLIAGYGSNVFVWDIEAEEPLPPLSSKASGTQKLYCLAVLSDGAIAAGGTDKHIHVWPSVRGHASGRKYNAHAGAVRSMVALPRRRLARCVLL